MSSVKLGGKRWNGRGGDGEGEGIWGEGPEAIHLETGKVVSNAILDPRNWDDFTSEGKLSNQRKKVPLGARLIWLVNGCKMVKLREKCR